MARAWHHLPVSALAVLWHLVLVMDYLALRLEMPFYTGGFTPEQLAWFLDMPLWMACAWALAVWSGVLAAVLLTARSGVTASLFALSLAAWLVTALALLLIRSPSAMAVTGGFGVTFLGLTVLAALLLFLYAREMHKRQVR